MVSAPFTACHPRIKPVVSAVLLCAILLPPPAWGQETSGDPSHVFGSSPETGWVPVEGGRLYFESVGDGPLVLVLHGFGARWRSDQWRHLLEALVTDYRVVGVDVRGHGRSSKPHDTQAYGLTLVSDVARILDHLGSAEAAVVGYSMGGIIALKAAERLPDRVRGVVLIGQGWLTREELGGMAEGARRLAEVDTAQLAEADRVGFRSNDVEALVALSESYPDLFVSPESLAALQVPLLAIVGTEDARVSRAEALSAVQPRAQVTLLEGRTHGSIVDDPAFAEAILDSGILSGVRPPGP